MTITEIGPHEAHANLKRFRVIDVREEFEFHGPLGFVEGAEHIPLSAVSSKAKILSGSKPLLIVCRSGKRSGRACERLRSLGARDVTNLAGGMIAWNQAALPVNRTEKKTLGELTDSIVCWLAQVTGTATQEASDRMDSLLCQVGVRADSPTPSAIDRALDVSATDLRESGAPPDLEMSLEAFRKDLALL